ncbi:hypothetical protein [Veillonella caviae]|uniref:hypothetical protein n=1 Tax=Veillonella caviae TaxID=248316 RepID=UPI002352663F|nr:hypothetical protein [Veillonella caviae]
MSIHDESMNLLKDIYDACNLHRSFNVSLNDYHSLSAETRNSLEAKIEYLKECTYIQNDTPCVGLPISVRITALGIRAIENIPTDNSAQIMNIYGSNYGVVGNNNSANTITNNYSFQDVQKIISKCTLSDEEKSELEAALKPLYDRIEIGAPIERGMLASISDKIKDYQPLLSAIVSSVTNFLIGSK